MGGRGGEGRSRAKPGNQLVYYIVRNIHVKMNFSVINP